MKHVREYEEFLNENTNAKRFQNKGKLRYSDQFSGNISLSKTIGTELGFDPKKGSSGVGFDNVSMYDNESSKTIVGDALTGKYTYDELVKLAKEWYGKNESIISEAASVPSNIMDFAKRKGSYAVSLVKKAATWAEKAGKRISGGTAIGKNYDTIILDMKHQGSEIYINLNDETIELFGEEVTDAKSFAKVLQDNE